VQIDDEKEAKESKECVRTADVRPEQAVVRVHTRFHPDSYDEWLPQADVETQPLQPRDVSGSTRTKCWSLQRKRFSQETAAENSLLYSAARPSVPRRLPFHPRCG
jgi:hypothetical protein